jgi:hypothetical protein
MWNWQCQAKCAASQTIQQLPFTYQGYPNWVGGGCILANYAMLWPFYHPCSGYVDEFKRFTVKIIRKTAFECSVL